MIYKINKDMSTKDITKKVKAKTIILYVAVILLSARVAYYEFSPRHRISYRDKVRVDTFERLAIFKHGLTKITVDRNSNIPSFCNNPGALRPSGNDRINSLAIGTVEAPSGQFLYFPNKELGFKALKILLTSVYYNHTIQKCIYAFAPPHENNSELYISKLTTALDCSSSTLVKDCNIQKLMLEIAKVEGFKSTK